MNITFPILCLVILVVVVDGRKKKVKTFLDPTNYCPAGQIQYADIANCGRGGTDGVCPIGFYCNIAPNDAYAVCCSEPVLDSSDICPVGQSQHAGITNCGRGGTWCPSGFYCNIAPNDAYAVCCSEPVLDSSDICPVGQSQHAGITNCGRGGTWCPSGFYCNIAPNDAYAVCCSDPSYGRL